MEQGSETAKRAVPKKYLYIGALVIMLVFTAAVIAAAISARGGRKSPQWEDSPLTAGIPAFSENADKIVLGDGYAAAYYSGVGSDEINAYVDSLGKDPGVRFGSSGFPRTAVYGEVTVALHYNVTERNFSVTVVKTPEIPEISENGDNLSK